MLKSSCFLITLLFFIFSKLNAQTIINPSNTAGYDSIKARIQAFSTPGVSLITDSADYQPGSTAIFTGTGFLPNEQVIIKVNLLGLPLGYGSSYDPFTVSANAQGSFNAYWYVDSQNLGRHLSVSARGVINNYSTIALFTDGTPLSSCYTAPDNTYINFPANDDGSLGPINLGFNFNLYGTNYNQAWINNNGSISFSGALNSFSSSGFPNTTPMVAGFWADADSRSPLSGTVKYKVFPGKLIVTWPGVGYYNRKGDLLNTFQIIITDGNDAAIGLGNNVALHYHDMQWTTGDASGGNGGGFGGTPATAGINKGDGVNYIQIGRFGLNSAIYDGGGNNTDGVNYLDYECFRFNVSSTTNQAPSVSGVPTNNTITIPCGTTQNINLTFLPPEINQSVSSTINTNGLCNTTSSSTTGSTSVATVSITGNACNLGSNIVTFTATDNFNPSASTTISITVNVVNAVTTASSNSACLGGNINLSTPSILGATYSWTGPNGFTSNTQNPTISNASNFNAGLYTVTVTANGCIYNGSTTVVVNALPIVNAITGQSIIPLTTVATLNNTVSGGVWSSLSPSIATINAAGLITPVGVGNTTIRYTVTNSNGCSKAEEFIIAVYPFVRS